MKKNILNKQKGRISMKRMISILNVGVVLFVFSATVSAADVNPDVEIEYFDDGSYLITTFEEGSSHFGVSAFSTNAKNVTKSKTVKYYDSNKVARWYVKVTGTFLYGKGVAKCTSSSVSAGTYGKIWKIVSKSAGKSGNAATAKATAKQYYNGTVIKTINKTVKLTCSSTGSFS